MSTVNDHEIPADPEHDESSKAPSPTPSSDAPDAADPAPASEESDFTSLYVRRGRTPTLGFWVALAIVLPALAALLSAPLFDFADISGVLNFMLVAAVFVGLPLAAIAALVDAIRHRGEGRRTR